MGSPNMNDLPREIFDLKGHTQSVNVVKYDCSGDYCISGGADKLVNIWNMNSKIKIKSLEGHGWEIYDIAV